MCKLLSFYHPWLYWLWVWQRRLWRYCRWRLGSHRYVRLPSVDEHLPYRYIKHTSKLIRRLGDNDLVLQRNKVVNLRLAADCMNGVRIGPGEYSSFCRLVGRPSARCGFVEGMELSFGEACSRVGGGICQLSNLIHRMALHSPLRVVERVNHSFDPFPDEGRILPFDSDAAIFYNFIDPVLHNPTVDIFQLRFHIAAHQLGGELLHSAPCPVRHHVYERAQCFVHDGEAVLRLNEIWRDIREKGQAGALLASECLYRNQVRMKYPLKEACLFRDWQTRRIFLRFCGHGLSATF